VIEDLQWSDEATLELLRVVGRRVAQLPAVVVGTFRDDLGPDHPLVAALGDIPALAKVVLDLPPLSVAAVQELAAGAPVDPVALHRAASGNPFYVTEALAAGGTELPTTVREAVLARARRLPAKAFDVVTAASVLGLRCNRDVLAAVADAASADIDDCLTRGMLRGNHETVEFRHELSRQAVLESLAASDRTLLHRRALSVLGRTTPSPDPGELAHHAVEAGDREAVLELSPRAGAAAAALGAHHAARVHYTNALRFSSQLPVADRATLLAKHARECFITDDPVAALTSQEQAVSCWRDACDLDACGRAMSDLAEYQLWSGDGDMARASAREAIRLLEPMAPSASLAGAYARLAQLLMVANHDAEAIAWGTKAVEVGEQLGEERVVVHALNTIGSAELSMGIDVGMEKLEESVRRAKVAGLDEDVARGLSNLIASARENRQSDVLDRYMDEMMSFAADRDLDLSARCVIGDITEALMNLGRWDEATDVAMDLVERGWLRGRNQCLMVLGRLSARRGEADAFNWLDLALDMLDPEMWGEGVYSVRAARAEAAYLAGEMRRAASEVDAGLAAVDEQTNPWLAGELAFWAHKLGLTWDGNLRLAEPYAFHLAGHPGKAAAAWRAVDAPYEEAFALLDCEDESDISRALEVFHSLGAAAAASLAAGRLRALGVRRISRGPRASTRANPAGLSNREIEVLALLADGLRNAEIAERLVLSTKTVDHHVSAVLAKLGLRSRYDAGRKAVELGLKAR
jgi:DNA-binding CsgD family transcriptional regulator